MPRKFNLKQNFKSNKNNCTRYKIERKSEIYNGNVEVKKLRLVYYSKTSTTIMWYHYKIKYTLINYNGFFYVYLFYTIRNSYFHNLKT